MADEKTTIEQIQTGFNDLKETFAGILKSWKGEAKFGTATTKDGKKIDYEGSELKEGITAKFGDEAIPDGDYTLENGDTCKIEGGIIKEFKKFEQEAVQTYSKEDLDAKFSALEKSNTESMSKLAEAITKLLSSNEKTLEVVQGFATQAKAPATNKNGQGAPATGDDERAKRIAKMRGLTGDFS